MQLVTNCQANRLVYNANNASRNYQYLVQFKSQINTMCQKQFNKTYVKHFPHFAKFPTVQKRIALVAIRDVFNQYSSTNQI